MTRCGRWYELLAYGSAGSDSNVKTSRTNGRCDVIRGVKDDHKEAALASSGSMVHHSAGWKVAVRQRSHSLLIRCQLALQDDDRVRRTVGVPLCLQSDGIADEIVLRA
jgi:hypothetical protein